MINPYFVDIPQYKEGTLLHNVYIVANCLGEGSFGRVYKAYKRDTHEVVAIKQTPKQAFIGQPKIEELYNSEVTILQNTHCENVVRYIDSFNTKQSCFLVLEYCNQGDLAQMLFTHKTLPEATVIVYFKHILNGFKALHKLNIVHRDLKPENILIHQQQLKISDLGFAKILNRSPAFTMLGTPVTMAPEILESKSYGLEVDVFSLGVITYLMIYGKYPYRTDIANFEKQMPELISSINYNDPEVNVSDDMKSLLKRMICYKRKERIKWHEIYEDKIVNSQNLGVSQILFGRNMLLVASNKQEAINLYQKFKNLYVDDDTPEGQSQLKLQIPVTKITQIKNDPYSPTNADQGEYCHIKLIEQRKNSILQCIQQITLKYIHFKSIYTQIFYTMKAILLLPKSIRNRIVLFLLAKKGQFMTNSMESSLKERENYFNIKYFNEFLLSDNFNSIYNELIGDFNIFKSLYEPTKREAQEVIQILKEQKKNLLVKLLTEELEAEELTNNFKQVLKLGLANQFQKMQEEVQQTSDADQESLYYKALNISIDVFDEENVFANLNFDFVQYNIKVHNTPQKTLIQQCSQKAYQLMLNSAVL